MELNSLVGTKVYRYLTKDYEIDLFNQLLCVLLHSQPAITCSKLTIETLEQGV